VRQAIGVPLPVSSASGAAAASATREGAVRQAIGVPLPDSSASGAAAASATREGAVRPATGVPPPATGSRDRSRSAEGRRYTRKKITEAFLSQWRYLKVPDRPMPPVGRRDSGLVPGTSWAEALRVGRLQTEELLRQEPSGYHGSVHLTLYLQWAAVEIRSEQSRRLGGLELGRHIQQFLS
jgi:hypothetical protein